MEFYVSIKGKKSGPFSHYEINGMLRDGEIDGDSLVWMRGQGAWEKLREIPALQSSLRADEPEEEAAEKGEIDVPDREVGGDSPPLPETQSNAARTIPIAFEVRPLTRFWARSFDYLLVTIFVWTISDISPPQFDPDLPFTELLKRILEETQKEEWRQFNRLTVMAVFGWQIIEGLLLHVFGTTPGKALFGIKIKGENGRPPAIFQAIGRSFYVYLLGVGLYLFPFSIICMSIGFFRLITTGKTSWDSRLNTTVEHPPLGLARILLAIGAFLALMIVQYL